MNKTVHAIMSRTRFRYVWIIVGITFLVLLSAAGIRATPSVMILPLQHKFGWSVTTISFVISVNITLYSLIGPFSAAAMQRVVASARSCWARWCCWRSAPSSAPS